MNTSYPIPRRDFLRALGLGASALAFGSLLPAWAKAAAERKLNFIFILTDDLGWSHLGCYGNDFIETPHLDRLAREGMRFTAAYVAAPLCSPTRASLLTGKHPVRTNILTIVKPESDDKPAPKRSEEERAAARKAKRLFAPENAKFLALEEVTIAEALKEAGYATGYVGKWHLGGEDHYPQKQGFDFVRGESRTGQVDSFFAPYKYRDRQIEFPDAKPGEYLTDRLEAEAEKFIAANKDKPFFLFLSHYAPHVPFQAPPELVAKYEAKAKQRVQGGVVGAASPPRPGVQQNRGEDAAPTKSEPIIADKEWRDYILYAAMMDSVDQNIGRLRQCLEKNGLADNTVILFSSDNGGQCTEANFPRTNAPFRDGKNRLYEGGVRVPLIVHAPGLVPAGAVTDTPVISMDIFPTLLALAGQPLRPDLHRDGIDLTPLIKKTGPVPERPFYWHYPYVVGGKDPTGAIRVGRWKLIENLLDRSAELYDLETDPGEKTNLAAKLPEKVKELQAQLHAWQKEINAPMPRLNPDYEPKK
jgi:arylsulfatase A-like enzyme